MHEIKRFSIITALVCQFSHCTLLFMSTVVFWSTFLKEKIFKL